MSLPWVVRDLPSVSATGTKITAAFVSRPPLPHRYELFPFLVKKAVAHSAFHWHRLPDQISHTKSRDNPHTKPTPQPTCRWYICKTSPLRKTSDMEPPVAAETPSARGSQDGRRPTPSSTAATLASRTADRTRKREAAASTTGSRSSLPRW